MMPLGVLTTSGREAHLVRLLREIAEQGWAGPRVLCVDGVLDAERVRPDLLEGWQVMFPARRCRDNGAAFSAMLLELAAAGAAESGCLTLEDDVHLSEGALELVAATSVPAGAALVSWFECLFRPPIRPGWYFGAASSFCYAQALTLAPATVLSLLAQPFSGDLGADAAIAGALGAQLVAWHVPALVQHEGKASMLHPGRGDFPRSATFVQDVRRMGLRAVA